MTGEAPELAPGNSFPGDVKASFRRYTLKNFRHPHTVGFALVQPVIYLILFTEVFGSIATAAIPALSVNYTSFLLPAIVIQVSLLAASASGIWLVDDIETGMMDRMLVSPMRRSGIFLGKTLAETVFTTSQILLILVAGTLLGAEIVTGLPGATAIIALGVAFSFWFTALSNVFAIVTESVEATVLMVNFLQLPLLFVSSAFLPLERLPGWIQFLGGLNPVTYGVDAARVLITKGWLLDSIISSLGVLLVLDLAFGALGIYFLDRATSTKTT